MDAIEWLFYWFIFCFSTAQALAIISLTSEEVIDILGLADVKISKGELSAVLRKEGHKNYKECGDRYLRNFLKGLAIQYRTTQK